MLRLIRPILDNAPHPARIGFDLDAVEQLAKVLSAMSASSCETWSTASASRRASSPAIPAISTFAGTGRP